MTKYRNIVYYKSIILFVFIFLSIFFLAPISSRISTVFAQTTDLQSKINQSTALIQALQKEIQGYQKQLDDVSSQADSLSSTIKSLDLTQKKLATDIKVTENKIATKNLEIQALTGQITNKESTISDDQRIIKYTFNSIDQFGDQSLPELVLGGQSIGEVLNSLDQISSIQKNLFSRIDSLRNTKTKLEGNRTASQKAKNDLVALNSQIKDQQAIVLSTTAEKNALLTQTKQSESQYRK